MDKKNSTLPEKYMDDIASCFKALKSGGIILFPSEAGWGIGCDATNAEAVDKFLKVLPPSLPHNPTVLVDHADRLGRYINLIPEAAIQLIEVNDKPMTLIYPGVVNIAPGILAGDGSAGIRITSDSFCKKLISTLSRPVAFSAVKANSFKEIPENFKTATDYVVKWRQNDSSHPAEVSIIKVGLKGEIEIIKP